MNVFQILKDEHKEAKEGIEQILATDDAEKRRQLFQQLRNSLEMHTEFEEQSFYPAARSATGMDDEIDDGLQEHKEAKQMLTDLADGDPGSEDWEDQLIELRDALEHHIKDEEEELFPAARKKISGEESSRLGQAYAELKQGRQAAE